MDLELDVSFDAKTISGHVVLSVEKVNVEANVLVSHSFVSYLVVLVRLYTNYFGYQTDS